MFSYPSGSHRGLHTPRVPLLIRQSTQSLSAPLPAMLHNAHVISPTVAGRPANDSLPPLFCQIYILHKLNWRKSAYHVKSLIITTLTLTFKDIKRKESPSVRKFYGEAGSFGSNIHDCITT